MTCTASRLVVVLQIHSISFVGQSAIQVTVEIYPGRISTDPGFAYQDRLFPHGNTSAGGISPKEFLLTPKYPLPQEMTIFCTFCILLQLRQCMTIRERLHNENLLILGK